MASSSDEDETESSGEDECAVVQKKTGRTSTRKPPPYAEKPKKKKLKSTKTTTSSSDEEETDGSGEDECAVVQKKTGLKSSSGVVPKKRKGTPKGTIPTVHNAASKKGGNFSNEEDVFLCRAFVNCSVDSIVGTNQKKKEFYLAICTKYNTLVEEAPVEAKCSQRDAVSLENRWRRQILSNVNKFIGFLRKAKDPPKSGFNEQAYIDVAKQMFLSDVSKAFGYEHCVPVLSILPRFDSSLPTGATEAGEGYNQVGAVMGSSMERPIGSKTAKALKAKQIAKDRKASPKLAVMKELSRSSAAIAKSIEKRRISDAKVSLAKLYASMGNNVRACEVMQDLEAEAQADEEERRPASEYRCETPIQKETDDEFDTAEDVFQV
jgi:hypothetical protein